jgi:hypothetical protein
VTVYGRLPQSAAQFVILLHLRPDDTVGRVESNVTLNLLDARTEAVYDQSGFYDITWRLLGRRCPGLSKIDLYRFFENTVKPQVRVDREDFPGGLFSLHAITSRAAGVPYCGARFGYSNLVEWRGAKDLRTARQLKSFSYFDLE